MKIVVVEWADSTTSTGWENDPDLELCICETVGYLAKKTREKVVLIQSISDGNNVDNKFAIPRGCIKSIKELR